MEQEIDLLGILRKIIAIRKTIYKAVGIGLIIGIIVTVSIPKQYTVEVTLSPEMGSRKSNGLSSLAASFLGGDAASSDGSDALNAFLSADIVSSTPFLLELKDMKVNEGNTTLDTYLDSQSSPWWSYVIGLPTMMVGGVKSLFSDEKNMTTTTNTKQGVLELTKKEAGKIGQLKKSISVVIEKKSAMTTVIVTFQNPKVAATVADSVVKKLQEYIISYRISKAKEDCIYLERLFKERQQEYYAAQKKYADYTDTHNNLILAYPVYSQVTNQLQLARAKVQEEKPVFAVIEPAVVPLQSSGKGFVIYALVFIFLCVAVAIGWELLGKGFIKTLKEGTQNK